MNTPTASSIGTNGDENDGKDGEKEGTGVEKSKEGNDNTANGTDEGKQNEADGVKSPDFLRELLEEAAKFCDVDEEELLESDSDLDESTLCLPKPISWPTALRLCKYDEREARQMMRANKQGIRLQQKRRNRHFVPPSTENRRMYRPRKAKDTLREGIYGFNNPKERGLLNCTARTLQDRIYNSMESCRQFASVAGRYAPKRHPTKTSLEGARRCDQEDAITSDEASDVDGILSALEDVDDEAGSQSSGQESSIRDTKTNTNENDVNSSSETESEVSSSCSETVNDDAIFPKILGTITVPCSGFKGMLKNEVDEANLHKEPSHQQIGLNYKTTASDSSGTTLKRNLPILEQNDSQSFDQVPAKKVKMTSVL